MKMTKSQFKVLMKECLTELINEGAFDKKLGQIAEAKMTHGSLGNKQPGSLNEINANAKFDDINPRILEAVNSITRNKQGQQKTMFQEILMDTALTSLQKQLDGATGLQENSPMSKTEIAAQEAELNVLAGGNPGRWAIAAFSGKQKP